MPVHDKVISVIVSPMLIPPMDGTHTDQNAKFEDKFLEIPTAVVLVVESSNPHTTGGLIHYERHPSLPYVASFHVPSLTWLQRVLPIRHDSEQFHLGKKENHYQNNEREIVRGRGGITNIITKMKINSSSIPGKKPIPLHPHTSKLAQRGR